MRHESVSLDLESNGFHRYPERLCLVQLSFSDSIYLIDPLSINDMTSFGDLLAKRNVEKVFHAAGQDIRSLQRDWGFFVRPLFDTSIAAGFLGYKRLGLASVLKDCIDVEIPKSKKLQRADWTVRPLPVELLEYAAADVRYLGRLANLLAAKLKDLGRTEWVREECERLANVRYSPTCIQDAFLSVKGSRNLDSRGLAVLRSLHMFREQEAVRRDRPPFKIFSDAVLIGLSVSPHSDLSTFKGIGKYAYGSGASGVRKAIREGLSSSPVERRSPVTVRRSRIKAKDRKAINERLRILKKWRLEQAERLQIDPGLVWPASSLERLAIDTTQFHSEMQSDDVRRWQCRELGELLNCFLNNVK